MNSFAAAWASLFAVITSFLNGCTGFAKAFEAAGNITAAAAGELEDEARYKRAVAAQQRALERSKQPQLTAP